MIRAKIRPYGDSWQIASGGVCYDVSSINNHCTEKLRAMYESGADVYLSIEEITEYDSDEYRAGISRHSEGGWHDDDVACLLRVHVPEKLSEAAATQLLIEGTEQQFVLFPEMLEEER